MPERTIGVISKSMLMQTLILLAASQASPGSTTVQGAPAAPSELRRAPRAIIATTVFNAFVATEETPAARDLAEPAIFKRSDNGRPMVIPTSINPIS